MAVQITRVKNVAIVHLDGPKLSTDDHQGLKDAFQQLREDSYEHAVVDMQNVEFMDSVGMGLFVSGRMLLRNRCEILICAVSPEIEAILTHAKLNQVFPIHQTLAAALKSLGIEAKDLDETLF